MKKGTIKVIVQIIILCIIELIFIRGVFININSISYAFAYSESSGIIMFAVCFAGVFYIPKIIGGLIKKINKVFNLDNFEEPTTTELDMLYDELYKKHIYELEVMRKKARFTTIVQNSCFAAFFIGSIISEMGNSGASRDTVFDLGESNG